MKLPSRTLLLSSVLTCLMASTGWAQVNEYSQDFEGLDQSDPAVLGNDGWLVGANVFDANGNYLYNYFAFPAPNGGPAFSAVTNGWGGANQGDQALVVYNDYNNGDHEWGNLIEANFFREYVIDASNVGNTMVFTFDGKLGDICCGTTAAAFIKVLNPNDGWSVSEYQSVDTTSLTIDWETFTLSTEIRADQVGHLFQIGFMNTTSWWNPSGVGYDNINLSAVPPASDNLIISEVVDGTLPNGTPKFVELTNTGSDDIDLSHYSFGNMNNGNTDLGGGASSVLAGILAPGDSYVIGYDSDNDPFNSVYGFDADYLMGGTWVNGDDTLILFHGAATGDGTDATIVDIYGVIGTDGTGEDWEYMDSYSYRLGTSGNDGVWDASDWFVAGANALEEGCSGDDACETINLQNLTTPGTHTVPSPGPGTAYCFGDGSGTACPCGNAGSSSSGCANSTGAGGTLTASGDPSLSNDTLVLEADGLVASQPCLFFSGANRVNGDAGIVFGDGLRCAGFEAVRIEVTVAGSGGSADTSVEVSTNGQAYGHTLTVGESVNYQCWYRDDVAVSPCGNSFNTTNGYTVVWSS
ncbi:MAG: lamin tail domain-containing protein [Planctomycetes bacterium]|nr:lamin tail domain-containing protein [Planctomycetota bacterium]